MSSRYSVMFGGADDEPDNKVEAPARGSTNARDGFTAERVDEEQLQKFADIIELLLAGGYFRARINGLSPFDKVVGGMAWSITASNVEVEVDIFFQENSTIGQRIKLSEELLKALRKMKCPYPIQAQQIQGLDYINLFPVIQWLVKKVIETREETGDLLRMYSETQFGKNYKMPEDIDFDTRKKVAVVYANELEDRYKPQRRFKRQKTSEATVQGTLLEYGKLNRLSKAPTENKPKNQAAALLESQLGAGASQRDADEVEAEENRIQAVMKTMDSVSGEGAKKITGSMIGSFISAEQIQMASQNLEEPESAATLGDAGVGQKLVAEKQHKHKVANLEKQIQLQKGLHARAESEFAEGKAKAEAMHAEVAAKAAFNERIISETAKLDALENDQNARQLNTLRTLVALNENLRMQETQFKANCKKQLAQMKEMIAALSVNGDTSTPDLERQKLIDETFGTDTAKMAKIRQLMNKKNRDIALMERKIDEVPSRAELMQYQRQFVDLYEQVSSRLTETRQYFSTYNTLEDTRKVLGSEVSILNSIHDNYRTAMNSKTSREKMLESMDGIVKSVTQNLDKEDGKLQKEKKTQDELNSRYLKLVEKERGFYKMTKEFQEECTLNEAMLSKA